MSTAIANQVCTQLDQRLTAAEAVLETGGAASPVLAAVVAEFRRKFAKTRPLIEGESAPDQREAIVELEQAGDSAKWAALADPAATEQIKLAVVSAHDAICWYKATGTLLDRIRRSGPAGSDRLRPQRTRHGAGRLVLAMAYAAAHPDRVERLILVGSGGPMLEFQQRFGDNIEARLRPEDLDLRSHWQAAAKHGVDAAKVSIESLRERAAAGRRCGHSDPLPHPSRNSSTRILKLPGSSIPIARCVRRLTTRRKCRGNTTGRSAGDLPSRISAT